MIRRDRLCWEQNSHEENVIKEVFTIKAIEMCSLPITDSRLFLSVTPNTVLSKSSSEGKGSTLFTLGDWKCISITTCSYYFTFLTMKILCKLYRLCAVHSVFQAVKKAACWFTSQFIYFSSSFVLFKIHFQYAPVYKSYEYQCHDLLDNTKISQHLVYRPLVFATTNTELPTKKCHQPVT